MAETTTVNYSWTKPDPGASANTWGTTLNATTDKIDAKLFENQGRLGDYLPLAGGTITGNFSVSGAATFSTISASSISAGGITSTGDISATGNIAGNNAVFAGSGGFSTAGPLTASGGINAGAAAITTTGNVSSNSVTTNSVTTGGATYFFHNTYGDFGTNINPVNNSRWLQFATGWSIQAIINSSAYYFYIGGNPVQTLDFAGNLVIYGQGYKPGGGAWGATSDERVKRDIAPYRSGLKELSGLNPISFAYNGQGGTRNDGKRYVGLVAQAARQVMPGLVHEMSGAFDGKIPGQLATDTSELVFALINAVNELSARVKTLEAR